MLGFSDTFAVIGVMLAIAAVLLLFARKGKPGGERRGALTGRRDNPLTFQR